MRVSARNQFAGIVSALKTGAVNDEVTLALNGGMSIVAVITRGSTQSLGLAVGTPAVALVKASSVILMQGTNAVSARNVLSGTVRNLQKGAVNAEVVVGTSGGVELVAIITNESVDRLGLAVGGSISAIFKASSVIIGVDS